MAKEKGKTTQEAILDIWAHFRTQGEALQKKHCKMEDGKTFKSEEDEAAYKESFKALVRMMVRGILMAVPTDIVSGMPKDTRDWIKGIQGDGMGEHVSPDGYLPMAPCKDCAEQLACERATDTPFVGTCSRYNPLDESCVLPNEALPYGEKLPGEPNGICGVNIPYKYW
jgi:hypothetical protein